MTTTANKPRTAFLRMLIPLLLGIGIGVSIGVNIGDKTPAPAEVASAPVADEGPQEAAPLVIDTDEAEPAAIEADGDGEAEIMLPEDDGDGESAEAPATPVVPVAPAQIPAPGESWPARHVIVAVSGTTLDEATAALFAEALPGAVMLTEGNVEAPEQVRALTGAIKAASGMGTEAADLPLIVIDPDRTPFEAFGTEGVPSIPDLGAAMDVALAQRTGETAAKTLHGLGIGAVLGPPMDVYEEGAAAGLAARSFGTDNALVTAVGLAMADGLMRGGVLPVIKHYPGHGSTSVDSRDALAILDKEIPGLAQVMFPFSESIYQGLPGVLAGHIAVPAIDSDAPDTPASMSRRMLTEILRGQWRYEGVILADDLNLPAVTATRSHEEAAIAALAAGADAVILLDPRPEGIRAVCSAIELAVQNGDLDGAQLQRSRERLEAWQAFLRSPAGIDGPLLDVPERLKVAAKAPAEPSAEVASEDAPEAEPVVTSVPDGEFATHTIERGETLSAIGRKYGVSAQDIMAWNNLADGNIKFGNKLKIYGDTPPPPAVEPEPEPAAEVIEETKAVEAVEAATVDVTPEPEAPAPVEAPVAEPAAEEVAPVAEEAAPAGEEPAPAGPAPQPAGTKRIEHEVVPGDMLSRLANRYGVRQADVTAWNALADTTIKVGQKLVFYVPESFTPEPDVVAAPVEEAAPAAEATAPEASADAPAAPEAGVEPAPAADGQE